VTHPNQPAWSNVITADAATEVDAAARRRRSERRAHVARTLARALDRRGVLDKVAASDAGVKRQVVSQWCRPGGTKNIGLAEASLLEPAAVRAELAELVAGAGYRVVPAPSGKVIAADVATAGLLIRRHGALLESYLAAHEDGRLTRAERTHLRELIKPLVDDLVGLDVALADESEVSR
jgi:hypothetical protein